MAEVSCSFYTEDIKTLDKNNQNNNKFIKLLDFDPSDHEITGEKNKEEIKKQFKKDIERTTDFCIKTSDGEVIDIAKEIKISKSDHNYKVTYDDAYKILTDTYKLSEKQTEYILAVSTQGRIGGGTAGFGGFIEEAMEKGYENQAENNNQIYNQGTKLTIYIDKKEGKILCKGAGNIFFKAPERILEYNKHRAIKNQLYSGFKAEDYIFATMTVDLGNINDTDYTTPKVKIDITAKGETGEAIVNDIKKNIATIEPSPLPQDIKKNYDNFLSSMPDYDEKRREFKKAVKDTIRYILNPQEQIDDLKKDLDYKQKQIAASDQEFVDSKKQVEELVKEISEKEKFFKELEISIQAEDDSFKKYYSQDKENTLTPLQQNLMALENKVSKLENDKRDAEKLKEYITNEKLRAADLNESLYIIKNLTSTPEIISEAILDHIDKKINDVPKSENNTIDKASRKELAKELTKDLQKIVDLDPKYLKRFSRDIIDQRAKEQKVGSKKNIIGKLSSMIKDAWSGYSKDSKEITKDEIQFPPHVRQAKMIGKKLKMPIDPKDLKPQQTINNPNARVDKSR